MSNQRSLLFFGTNCNDECIILTMWELSINLKCANHSKISGLTWINISTTNPKGWSLWKRGVRVCSSEYYSFRVIKTQWNTKRMFRRPVLVNRKKCHSSPWQCKTVKITQEKIWELDLFYATCIHMTLHQSIVTKHFDGENLF